MDTISKVTSFVIKDAASYLYYKQCTPEIQSETRSRKLKFPYVVHIFFNYTTEAFQTKARKVSEEELASYSTPRMAKELYDHFASGLRFKCNVPGGPTLGPAGVMGGPGPVGVAGTMLGSAWSAYGQTPPSEAAWNGLIHGWSTPEDTDTLTQKLGTSSAADQMVKKKAEIFDSQEDETLHSEICVQFTKAGFDHIAMHALQQTGKRGELMNGIINCIEKDGWYGPCALSVITDLAVAIGLTPNHFHLNFKVLNQE